MLAASIPLKLLCLTLFKINGRGIYIISFVLNIIFCLLLSLSIIICMISTYSSADVIKFLMPVFIIAEYLVYRISFIKDKTSNFFLMTIFINIIPIGIMKLIYHINNISIHTAVSSDKYIIILFILLISAAAAVTACIKKE